MGFKHRKRRKVKETNIEIFNMFTRENELSGLCLHFSSEAFVQVFGRFRLNKCFFCEVDRPKCKRMRPSNRREATLETYNRKQIIRNFLSYSWAYPWRVYLRERDVRNIQEYFERFHGIPPDDCYFGSSAYLPEEKVDKHISTTEKEVNLDDKG